MRRGLVESREDAHAVIALGRVLVDGAPALKPARLVSTAEAVIIQDPPPPFVSRGGEKLDAGLRRFGVEVDGRRALDAGASTGGFTDCLLQRGAAEVVAVDVGYGQLHPRLRDDPRVVLFERTNVRTLTLDAVGGRPFDVVVADLSFISLRTVAPVLAGALAAPGGDALLLVKPQFEADRVEATRGRGVIRAPETWGHTLERVATTFRGHGAAMIDAMVSPLKGADGNVEFLLHLRLHTPQDRRPDQADRGDEAEILRAAVEAAVAREET